MNKIKDLLYDKNDFLVALVILCIAAFVIFTRINHIMDYPHVMTADGSSTTNVQVTTPSENDPSGGAFGGHQHENGDGEDNYTTNGEGYDINGEGDPSEYGDTPTTNGVSQDGDHSFYIAAGQAVPTIARNIMPLGIFDSEEDFIAVLESHPHAATRIQVGNFTIPADATRDDVIRIITNPAR